MQLLTIKQDWSMWLPRRNPPSPRHLAVNCLFLYTAASYILIHARLFALLNLLADIPWSEGDEIDPLHTSQQYLSTSQENSSSSSEEIVL